MNDNVFAGEGFIARVTWGSSEGVCDEVFETETEAREYLALVASDPTTTFAHMSCKGRVTIGKRAPMKAPLTKEQVEEKKEGRRRRAKAAQFDTVEEPTVDLASFFQ